METPPSVVAMLRDVICAEHGSLKKGYAALKQDGVGSGLRKLAEEYAGLVIDDGDGFVGIFMDSAQRGTVQAAPGGYMVKKALANGMKARGAVVAYGKKPQHLTADQVADMVRSTTVVSSTPAGFVAGLLLEQSWERFTSQQRCWTTYGLDSPPAKESFAATTAVSFQCLHLAGRVAFTSIVVASVAPCWRVVLSACEHQGVTHLVLSELPGYPDLTGDLCDAAACFAAFRYLKEVWVHSAHTAPAQHSALRVAGYSESCETAFKRLLTINKSHVGRLVCVPFASLVAGDYHAGSVVGLEAWADTTAYLNSRCYLQHVPKVVEVADIARHDLGHLKESGETMRRYEELLMAADREIQEVKQCLRMKSRSGQGDSPYIGLEASDTMEGILVHNVVPFTPAYYAGICKDDVITAVDKKPTPTVRDMAHYLKQSPPSPLTLHVQTPTKLPKLVPLNLDASPKLG